MEQIIRFTPTISSNKSLFGGFVAAYLVVLVLALQHYLPWTSVNFILGCLIIPFALNSSWPSTPSLRLQVPAILFLAVSYFIPKTTTLFLALTTSLLCLVEHKTGKISLLAVIVLLCMTPSIQYLSCVFSFPIRLWLTTIAGKVLGLTGCQASVAGNIITLGKLDYSVDPACMGVKMFLTSLLCGIFMVLVLQKKQSRKLGAGWQLLCLSGIFLLNLLANIIRIVILVYFKIRPEAPLHEITGLICLIAYVLVPGYFLAKFMVNNFGRATVLVAEASTSQPVKSRWVPHLLLLITCICSAFIFKSQPPETGSHTAKLIQVPGYTASCFNKDVTQYSNGHSLTYIKRIDSFLFADHNPFICWTGSGYEFEALKETNVDGNKVYLATLKKGKERLYTSWWYDNGAYATTSQLNWRLRSLKGAPNFSVVNVTAADKDLLLAEVRKIKREGTFREALR